MSGFELHPRLAADCVAIGRFVLCRVLLMNDRTYPWLILVPERAGVAEICDLPDTDQQQLMAESSRLSHALRVIFQPDKLNIAAIGNLVPQLHVHHIARFRSDPAWPGTVWGGARGEVYATDELAAVREAFRSHLPQLGPVA